MIDEAQLATTHIAWSCRVGPLKNVVADLSGILAGHSAELLGAFYPRTVAKKLNVVLTELVNNVLENFVDTDGVLEILWTVGPERLTIRVSGPATPEQHRSVRDAVEQIYAATDPKVLLRDTIRARHKERLPGGLGLIRLVAENKFSLAVRYNAPTLTVESQFALGGAA